MKRPVIKISRRCEDSTVLWILRRMHSISVIAFQSEIFYYTSYFAERRSRLNVLWISNYVVPWSFMSHNILYCFIVTCRTLWMTISNNETFYWDHTSCKRLGVQIAWSLITCSDLMHWSACDEAANACIIQGHVLLVCSRKVFNFFAPLHL